MYGMGLVCSGNGWDWWVWQLERVPATFWGVVAGSFFTLIGVYLTNRNNNRRQAAQLEHDRETKERQLAHDRDLKNREREMEFRKEVFTQVAEAIMAGMYAVMRHADLSIPVNAITSSFLEKAPSVSKAHLIANEKTVEALVNLMSEFGATFLRLAPERYQLALLQEQIKVKDTLIAQFGQQRDGLLQMMQHHNIEAIHDQPRFQRIEQAFLSTRDVADRFMSERAQLQGEVSARSTAYVRRCFAESMRVGKLIPTVLVSAREELEVAVGRSRYADILERARLKAEENFNEFLATLGPS